MIPLRPRGRPKDQLSPERVAADDAAWQGFVAANTGPDAPLVEAERCRQLWCAVVERAADDLCGIMTGLTSTGEAFVRQAEAQAWVDSADCWQVLENAGFEPASVLPLLRKLRDGDKEATDRWRRHRYGARGKRVRHRQHGRRGA